jgi:transposase-like protein
MSDLSSRSNRVECPRCKALMDEVVRIAPVVNETGLIAYECPVCEYVTSVLWQP